MKKIFTLFLIVFFIGCAYDADKVRTWVTDTHYARYQEKVDALEKDYLDGGITYAKFIEKKKELDEQYDHEVREREKRMHQ